MHHYIAFLRGINLGQRRIRMDDLRTRFEALKFTGVATFIASGNVVFASTVRDTAKLETTIQRHLLAPLGYEVDTFVRTRAEVAAAAAFPTSARAGFGDTANTLHVGFLSQPLSPAQSRGLVACRTEVDEFRVEGREYYWLCRCPKTSDSKVWTLLQLKLLKLPSSSMRNIKTIRSLAALFPALPP